MKGISARGNCMRIHPERQGVGPAAGLSTKGSSTRRTGASSHLHFTGPESEVISQRRGPWYRGGTGHLWEFVPSCVHAEFFMTTPSSLSLWIQSWVLSCTGPADPLLGSVVLEQKSPSRTEDWTHKTSELSTALLFTS
ncbi:uncharacterized protein LOC117070369 isoform X2 [Trachypithecus francoisi]|uniref:uncharacterized protein LOC117070369 isoform X2 n=1 Tax=Trachypithecus francoisi TaxID=54180 RepID=UPI00141A81A0|nr:uncharacterized protein LOC117070369 isoform X2 [Trachypithecus francoisi]